MRSPLLILTHKKERMFYVFIPIIEHTFCNINDKIEQIRAVFFDKMILCDEVISYNLQKREIMV